VPLIVGGTPLSVDALFARLMGHARRVVTERRGAPPDHVVLTHPASWGPYKLDVLTGAARLAGIDAPTGVSLLSEPEAAAVHHASVAPLARGATVAVYDLGGGTFDAAVLRRTVGGFALLGRPEGIERFGGTDIDAAVLDHVRGAVSSALDDLDPDDPNAAAAVGVLRRACTEAKEALSADSDAVVVVALPGLHTQVRIHRSELEARIRPPLVDTVDALARTIASAGLTPADLDAVLLVGGSSRIPLVAELITATLGTTVGLDIDPELAVALGAAAVAERRARRAAVAVATPVVAPPPDPAPEAEADAATGPPARAGSAPHPLATTAANAPADPGPPAPVPSTPEPEPAPEAAPPPPAPTPSPVPDAPPARRGRRGPLVVAAGALALAVVAAVVMLLGGDEEGDDGDAVGQPLVDDDAVVPVADIESILFESTAGGDHAIWIMNPDGTDPRPFIDTDGAVDLLPTISRDRTRVAWLRGPSADAGGTFELRVASTDAPGDEQIIVGGLSRFTRAAWLPDASALLVPVDGVLTRVDPETLATEAITFDGDAEECLVADPQVSPDATRVAFRCNRPGEDGQTSVFVADIDGSDSRLVADEPGIDTDPWWSPDGTELVFRSDRDGDPDLYVVAAAGGEPRLLTDNDVIDQDPAWLPDDTIAFSRSVDDGVTQDLFLIEPGTGDEQPLLGRAEVDGVVAG
jgi:actin-like ATPase involved in cell morphogenesis